MITPKIDIPGAHGPGRKWIAFLLAIVIVLMPATTVSALQLTTDVQVHGFLTQGYFLTSSNKLFGNSDDGGSLKFTEIGINSSWEISPKLRIAAQLLSRRAGKGSDGEIDLDFGLADYTVIDRSDCKAGLRVGRVRLPYGGFWNDARDVAFARPSILLPQSIYPDVIRSTQISGDGAEVYGRLLSKWGEFDLQFVGYYPRVGDRESEAAFLLSDFPGTLEGRPSYIGRLLYDYDNGRIKLGLSGGYNGSRYSPASASPNDLTAGTTEFSFIIFSAQYNTDHWSFTAEYKQQPFRSKGYTSDPVERTLFEDNSTGESYYGQISYRPNDLWEAVVRYDVLYADMDDHNGSKRQSEILFASGGKLPFPGHVTFAKDWMVGLRFNITKDLMVRTEYHRVFGTGWLSPIDNPPFQNTETPTEAKANWDIFALLFSYRF